MTDIQGTQIHDAVAQNSVFAVRGEQISIRKRAVLIQGRSAVHADKAHADPASTGVAPEGVTDGLGFCNLNTVAIHIGADFVRIRAGALTDVQLSGSDGTHGSRYGR